MNLPNETTRRSVEHNVALIYDAYVGIYTTYQLDNPQEQHYYPRTYSNLTKAERETFMFLLSASGIIVDIGSLVRTVNNLEADRHA